MEFSPRELPAAGQLCTELMEETVQVLEDVGAEGREE